jgi:hypothetical protein
VTDEIIMLTPLNKHDAFAVNHFMHSAIKRLKKAKVPVFKVIAFSDNCVAQYKCKTNFALMSTFDVPLELHYFGECHGKSLADAAIGRFKQLVDNAVRNRRAEIQNTVDLAHYSMTKLATTEEELADGCCHYINRFEYILEENIIREFKDMPSSAVVGSSKFHCVKKTTDPNIILTREYSSFCKCRFAILLCKYLLHYGCVSIYMHQLVSRIIFAAGTILIMSKATLHGNHLVQMVIWKPRI